MTWALVFWLVGRGAAAGQINGFPTRDGCETLGVAMERTLTDHNGESVVSWICVGPIAKEQKP